MVTTSLKYDFIAEEVRQWLLSGKFKEGAKLPTDEELASHFRVNKRTVAQGLNKLVAEDLLQRAPKLGTIVKRSVIRPVTNSVGFLTIRTGELYADTAAYCDELLLEHGLFPVLLDNFIVRNKEKIASFLERMTYKNQPYGFLTMGDTFFPYDLLLKDPARYANFIFMFRYHGKEEIPWCRYVLTDYHAMGKMIVEHFASAGVKRILFPAIEELEHRGVWSSLQEQLSIHIRKYAAENGMMFDDELFTATLKGTPYADILPERLRDRTLPTGIFCWSDFNLAHKVADVARANGIDLFKDFALLGNFNTKWAEACNLDSFDIQTHLTVKTAVNMLTGADTRTKVMIPPILIKHGSVIK